MEGISRNLTISISDHLAQFLIIPSKKTKIPKKQKRFKRDTMNFDRINFILDLLELVLERQKNDPNLSFNAFESKRT